MKKLTLKELKKNGIELANYTLRSFSTNGTLYFYDERPISAYVFYYCKEYVVYTFIEHTPLIQSYMSYKDAFARLENFVQHMNH